MNGTSSSRNRLSIVLSLVFVAAIVMGAGPGLYLVNPDPNDLEATITWLGVPVVYAWVICWFVVQACVVLVAYFSLWNGVKKGRDQVCRNGPRPTCGRCPASHKLDLSPLSRTEADR